MTQNNINAKMLQPAPRFLWVSFGLLRLQPGLLSGVGPMHQPKVPFHDRQATIVLYQIVRLRNGDKKYMYEPRKLINIEL